MKNIIVIVIVGALILGGLGTPAVFGGNTGNIKHQTNPMASLQDEVDQEQTQWVEPLMIPVGWIPLPGLNRSLQVAQSFIPQKEVLTRVELYIGKNSTTAYPCTVAIREELTEDNLVEIAVEPDEFATEELEWTEFNFENIWVTPGETYYIVCYTENITDNYYAWGTNNDSQSYPNGCAWFSIDDGDTWGNESATSNPSNLILRSNGIASAADDNETWDMCFKTYGIEETFLEIEFAGGIFGPSFIIRNIGEVSAYEVVVTASITGGFLGMINKTVEGSQAELPPSGEMILQFGFVLGFGRIEIAVTASALNAREVETQQTGFILLFYIMIT